MDLERILNEPNSRHRCREMLGWVGNNQKRFDDLIAYLQLDPQRIAATAAWMVDYCVEQHPELIEKHIDQLVKRLPGFKHQGVQRGVVRMLARLPLPQKHLGLLLHTCMEWLVDSDITVAVKVHCMQIAYRIALSEPEIAQELTSIIEEEIPKNTIAFASRGRKILAQLNK